MRRWLSKVSVTYVCFALVLTVGCSGGDRPELVEVSGTITKNGKPFVDAMVEFYPEASAGVSCGMTDSDGNFTLNYSTGQPGAAIGKHTVNVTGGRVVGAPEPPAPSISLAAMEAAKVSSASDEILAPVADPTKAVASRGGPPAPVVLNAEVVAGAPNTITLTMP